MSGHDLGNDLQAVFLLFVAGLSLVAYSVGMSLGALGVTLMLLSAVLTLEKYREARAGEESPQEVVDA